MGHQEDLRDGNSGRKKVVIDGGQTMGGLQAVYEIEFTEPGSPEDEMLRTEQAKAVMQVLLATARRSGPVAGS